MDEDTAMCCETMSVVAEEELRMVEVVKGGTRFCPEAAEAKRCRLTKDFDFAWHQTDQ